MWGEPWLAVLLPLVLRLLVQQGGSTARLQVPGGGSWASRQAVSLTGAAPQAGIVSTAPHPTPHSVSSRLGEGPAWKSTR